MRVLINYAQYADRVTIYCLAEDARTVVGPCRKRLFHRVVSGFGARSSEYANTVIGSTAVVSLQNKAPLVPYRNYHP